MPSANILDRELITIADAARIVPTRPHIGTIFRWMTRGVRGRVLASWLIGGQRFTSRVAIEDFLAALNGSEPPSITEERERAIAAAERELDEAGV